MTVKKYAPPLVHNLPWLYQGKTRDTFEARWPDPNDKRRSPLLIVASNRLSTHNVVHHSEIPKKGEVLTALPIFWLVDVLERAGISHHLLAYGKKIYDYLPAEPDTRLKNLHYQAIVVKGLDIIKVEFIFRAYLCGSLWADYYSQGLSNPYGIKLPPSLPLMKRFEEPIFTPTVKSDTDPALVSDEVEREHETATALARQVFELGRHHLQTRGVECLDTKFECGRDEDGALMLADEVLTPDSSRFARLADIKEGENPPWLDKQIARDKAEQMWAGGPKVPLIFPPLVVNQLKETYLELFEQVVGMPLSQFQRERLD